MKEELFKLQRPMHTNDPDPNNQVLVYNKSQSIVEQIPMAKDLEHLFNIRKGLPESHKMFLYGHLKGNVFMHDGVRYPDPHW